VVASLALALHLALAAPPGLAPPLDPGPLRGGELAWASLGAFAGDAAVLGAGWLTLQAFANGTLSPTGDNFRRAAYVFGTAALVLPPLGAVLLARWRGRGLTGGSVWRALLLATAGQAAALTAGWLAAPHLWVVLPVQVVTVSLGASLGLHWGRPRAPAGPGPSPALDAAGASAEPAAADARALFLPLCPIDA
jgi:hypothetical protein